ncbi:MAG: alpha/beta hydrolase [Anaerolineales bacterium]|nr:alpha/beta hydrolase [Anaerolineales bacterium]
MGMQTAADYEIDGTRLHVQILGAGRPLLLIHGWTNNGEIWRPLATELAGRYQAIMVDLPGFGQSGLAPDYHLARISGLLLELVRRLGVDRPVVAGLSMGCFLAADLLQRYPEQFSGAILVGPILAGNKKRWIRRGLRWSRRFPPLGRLFTRGVRSPWSGYIMERFINSRHYDPSMTASFRNLGRRQIRPEAYLPMGRSAFQVEIEAVLAATQTPVLLVYGEYDKHARPEQLATLCRLRPGIAACCIPGAAHNSPYEAPAACAAVIDQFLASVPGPLRNDEMAADDAIQLAAGLQPGQRLV